MEVRKREALGDHATTLLPAPQWKWSLLPSDTRQLLELVDNAPLFSAYKINMNITNDLEEIYGNCQGNVPRLNG